MPAADRRQAILDAALYVFSAAGYHEVSLDDIAARAGISKALIYEHFGSKRELHRALLEGYASELVGTIAAAAEAAASPGEARLRAGVEAFLTFVEERREAWRMVFLNAADPEVADSVDALRDDVARTIAALMAADAPPSLREDPVELGVAVEILAQQLVGAVQSLANWWDGHREVPREHLLELVMDFAWVGLDRVSRGERWRSVRDGL